MARLTGELLATVKRYDGIVIDGTSFEIKLSLLHFDRHHIKLNKPSRTTNQYMQTASIEKSGVQKVTKLATEEVDRMVREGAENGRNFEAVSPTMNVTGK